MAKCLQHHQSSLHQPTPLALPSNCLCRQHGVEKARTYARLGFWHPDFSLPARPKPGVSGSFAARPTTTPASNTTGSSNVTDAAIALKGAAAQPEGGVQQAGPPAGSGEEAVAAAGSVPAVGALTRAPMNHPALAAAGLVLAVAGIVGCTTGLVLWRRSRAAGQHHHRLIKTIPTPPRASAPASP